MRIDSLNLSLTDIGCNWKLIYKQYVIVFISFPQQALQAAHLAEALHSDYLLEWMKNISNDLIKLESDAAPNGWKCLWNRYVNKPIRFDTHFQGFRHPQILILFRIIANLIHL